MAPSNIKLTYFNGKGRAEQIRWILVQAGCKYEDVRVESADWPALKPSTPIGSLPYLEADGKKIATSGAVALYLARELGLNGSNNLEAAQVHMIWEVTQDAFNAFGAAALCSDKEKQAELFKKLGAETIPKYLNFLSARLEGGKEWLVGNKVSLADLCAVATLEQMFGVMPEVIKANALASGLANRVRSLPNIKKWIDERPATDF